MRLAPGWREAKHSMRRLRVLILPDLGWWNGRPGRDRFIRHLLPERHIRLIGQHHGLRGFRVRDLQLPAIEVACCMERCPAIPIYQPRHQPQPIGYSLSRQPHPPILPSPIMPNADVEVQRPLEIDLGEADGSPGFEPPLLVRVDPIVHALLQSVEFPLRSPPRDLELACFGHISRPTGILDELVQEHRIEIVLHEKSVKRRS